MTRVIIPGKIAQDKDWAREARRETILPSLQANQELVLDFGAVEIATQSFIHALLSEATHLFGEAGLDRIEFRRCASQVKEAIQTVVTYSLRARDLAAEVLPDGLFISSADIPQADDLQKVRDAVEIVCDGPVPVDIIAKIAAWSTRHAYYRVNAARTLDLLAVHSRIAVVTTRGRQLSQVPRLSHDEQKLLREAVASSRVISTLAPGLLGKKAPKPNDISSSMMHHARLSQATAARRVQCLLSWRRQLLDPQLPLPISSRKRSDSK